jgi:hypothetical protein
MAMDREIMEAAHGNNNDNTLMINSPKAVFENLSFIHHETLFSYSSAHICLRFCLTRPYIVYLFLLDSCIIYNTRRLNLTAPLKISIVDAIKSFQQVATFP